MTHPSHDKINMRAFERQSLLTDLEYQKSPYPGFARVKNFANKNHAAFTSITFTPFFLQRFLINLVAFPLPSVAKSTAMSQA